MTRQVVANYPSAATRADSSPGGQYIVDFTALGADESPISRGGIWTNNSQGTGGNAVMGTNTSMQIRLASDGVTRICCESAGPHINYEDSFALVPGFPGAQRVQATIYRAPGYAPNDNHELELYLGGKVLGNNNKRCIQVTCSVGGLWNMAVHDGAVTAYTPEVGGWVVIDSATVGGGIPADGHLLRAEFDPVAKTCKLWSNEALKLSTQWNTTHDEIDARVQTVLNNLFDGAGLAMIRRSGDTVEGGAGFRDFAVYRTLLG